MVKPILVFGYVNPSRGDDALDSELLDFLQKHTVIRLDLNNQRVTQLGILYSD